MPSILTYEEKKDIYEMHTLENFKRSELAEMYCVSKSTIARAIKEVELESTQLVVEDDDDEEESIQLYDWNDSFLLTTHEDLYDDLVEVEEPNPEVDYHYWVVANNDSVTINRVDHSNDDKMSTVSIVAGDELFNKVSDLVWSERGSQASLHEAYLVLDKGAAIEAYSDGNLTVDCVNNSVFLNNDDGTTTKFSGRLVDRLLNMVANGDKGLSGLSNFAKKLALNPSYRAVNSLYDFIEATDIDILEDGDLLCYKRITEDYKDCHTGTIDNSVGTVVSLPRNEVNEDPEETCSYGLHVCSKSYLSHFGGARVVRVKVNPADFVAIPTDYGNSKARVCKYLVTEDVTDTIEY